MNGVNTQRVDEGKCYKYLGQDKNMSYVGTVNKEVSREYFTRVKKIWKFKLSAFNKTIVNNTNIQYFRLDHKIRNIDIVNDQYQLLSIICQSKESESGRVADELCCKYDKTI